MRRPWQEPSIERAPGFEDFVHTRSPRLLALARGLTCSNVTAQELVQSVLAQVLDKWDTISRADDPDATVSRMLVKASFRRRFGGGRPAADESSALLQALATLRPKHRAVMVLRYYEGLNDHEIAATLGMTHASVRSGVARGLVALRKAGVAIRDVGERRTRSPLVPGIDG